MQFPLFPIRPGILYINFGFWDSVRRRKGHEPGHFNRPVEQKLHGLGGINSLYYEAFYSRDAFDRLFNGESYAPTKKKYDPDNTLSDLYDKCVKGA